MREDAVFWAFWAAPEQSRLSGPAPGILAEKTTSMAACPAGVLGLFLIRHAELHFTPVLLLTWIRCVESSGLVQCPADLSR